MTFVLLAFATFLVGTTLMSLLPFRVPARIQPFMVIALAYGLYNLPPMWLMIVAAGGGVALIGALAGEALDPWEWTKIRNLIPKRVDGKRERRPGVGVRIPTLWG